MNATGPLAPLMAAHAWLWPTCEVLHFIGLTTLLGTVALFDLRILGFARDTSVASWHRWSWLGFAALLLNAVTGAVFLLTLPQQYLVNAAFSLKLIALALAGLNVLFFYGYAWPRVRQLGPGQGAPFPARCSAAISLLLLIAIVCFGRFTAFYKFVPL